MHLFSSGGSGSDVSAPAPVLDGKRVLPYRVIKTGLKGHKVAAVYALLNSDYKRGYVYIGRHGQLTARND